MCILQLESFQVTIYSSCHLAWSRPKSHLIGLPALCNMELKTTSSFDLYVLYSPMQYGSNGYAESPI